MRSAALTKFFVAFLSIITSLVLIFSLVWCIVNFDTVKSTMDGTKIYTYEDVTNSFKDGYAQGCENEDKLVEELESHKTLVNVLTEQVLVLEETKSNLESQVATLQSLVETYERRIENLTADINQLEKDYLASEGTIRDLYERLENMEYGDSDLIEELTLRIDYLENQNAELRQTISALQSENNSLYQEVFSLYAQIERLEKEISSLNKISSTLRDQLIALGVEPVA